MNPAYAWLIASQVLLFTLIPCGIAVFRGSAIERLVALEMAGMVQAMLMVCLAETFRRVIIYDLALAMALPTFGGGLVFARFLERWL
jgi:multisubunit Na+/H+ antiporter MnhF subunit